MWREITLTALSPSAICTKFSINLFASSCSPHALRSRRRNLWRYRLFLRDLGRSEDLPEERRSADEGLPFRSQAGFARMLESRYPHERLLVPSCLRWRLGVRKAHSDQAWPRFCYGKIAQVGVELSQTPERGRIVINYRVTRLTVVNPLPYLKVTVIVPKSRLGLLCCSKRITTVVPSCRIFAIWLLNSGSTSSYGS